MASVKSEIGEVGGVTEPVSPDVVVSSGNAGSPISRGVPEPVGDDGAVSAPQASRTAVRAAARRALPGLVAGGAPGGQPCGTRQGRRCPGSPASCVPCALPAVAACASSAVCGLCPGCMPSGCAPDGPGRRGRRRPCGKRSQESSCGDRNDSECHRIRLGRRLCPVVASPRSILRIAPASAGDGPGMLTSRVCTRVSRDVPPGDTVAVPVITVRHGERVAVRRRHQAPSAPAPSRSPAPVRVRKRAEPRGRTQKKNPGTRPGTARPSPE